MHDSYCYECFSWADIYVIFTVQIWGWIDVNRWKDQNLEIESEKASNHSDTIDTTEFGRLLQASIDRAEGRLYQGVDEGGFFENEKKYANAPNAAFFDRLQLASYLVICGFGGGRTEELWKVKENHFLTDHNAEQLVGDDVTRMKFSGKTKNPQKMTTGEVKNRKPFPIMGLGARLIKLLIEHNAKHDEMAGVGVEASERPQDGFLFREILSRKERCSANHDLKSVD